MESMAATGLSEIDAAPLRKVRFWRPEIETETRADGSVIVRQRGELVGLSGHGLPNASFIRADRA